MKKIILFIAVIIGFVLVQNMAFSQDYDIYTVAYMNRLQNKVKSNWNIPHGQADKKTIVIFKIKKDGQIINANISNKSGDEEFDQNALTAIYKSSPFESIPQNVKSDNLTISFTFTQNQLEAAAISETTKISETKQVQEGVLVDNNYAVSSEVSKKDKKKQTKTTVLYNPRIYNRYYVVPKDFSSPVTKFWVLDRAICWSFLITVLCHLH